jgi:hypothetical protein
LLKLLQPPISRPTTDRPLIAKKYSRPRLKLCAHRPSGANGMTIKVITLVR